MAIELECGICGQEHRFRDEHFGRQTRCKECTARIDIPRGGLGGILDGTTPVFTPPVVIVGGLLLSGVLFVVVWEIAHSSGSGTSTTTTPVAVVPRQPTPAPLPKPFLPTIPRPQVSVPPTMTNPTPSAPSPLPKPFPDRPNVADQTPSVPEPSGIDANRPRQPVVPSEQERIRENYRVRGTPLVTFTTPVNQPVQIREIVPTWAEPADTIRLRGCGFSKTNRVVAIGHRSGDEHELAFRVISDGELSVAAPPECRWRNECAFVFEVYSPEGVAVTLPRELLEANERGLLGEFGIVRRGRTSVVLTAFALLDESGSIETLNSARVYLLRPTSPQRFGGVVTKILHTKESVVESVSGARLEEVTVPAIFFCYLDKMFAGPECSIRRLRNP